MAKSKTQTKIEVVPIEQLIADPGNVRLHPDRSKDALSKSVEVFGVARSVVADRDGVVRAGNGTLEAARAAGIKEAIVIEADGKQLVVIKRPDWTNEQAIAYAIADNRTGEFSTWDEKQAGELAKALIANGGQGLVDAAGFSPFELAALLDKGKIIVSDHERAAPVVEDEPPELPKNPITKPGDVWQLGDHRLVCGDSRIAQSTQIAVGGRQINIGFTSPPYAEQRDYDKSSGFEPIKPDNYIEWFAPVAKSVFNNLAIDGSWFVNIKASCDGLDTFLYCFDLVIAHVRAWGWHFATEFCWERIGVPKSVSQRFKNQFEPVYQFAKDRWKMRPDAVRHESENVPTAGGSGVGNPSWKNSQGGNAEFFGAAKKRRNGVAGRLEDLQGLNKDIGAFIGPGLAYPGNRLPTFWSTHTATGHTAAFPVGLPDFFIRAYTDRGDLVFDPFAGSGTVFIAAEQNERRGAGVELSPAYCDVTVERWQNLTGKKATREGAIAPAVHKAKATMVLMGA